MGSAAKPSIKLLIVDDDPATRELLGEALEHRGASVRMSADAADAQRTFATWHPDLVISDLGMPYVDGYELIRRVRRLTPEQGGSTPAIACTSYSRAEDRERAMHAGFDAVICKPVNLDALVETIAHVAGARGFGTVAGVPAAGKESRPPSDAPARARSAPVSYARKRL
jgi:CheY-like chemotaxis protein